MSTIFVAVAELLRVGPWALRALGFSFGVAERGSVIVTLAEVLHRDGLRTLRVRNDTIRRGAAVTSTRVDTGPGALKIDASGKSLIEVGPAAIDLAASATARHDFARLTIEGIPDPELLPSVLSLAPAYGLTVMAAFGGLDSPGGDDASRTSWIIAAPSPSGAMLFEGPADDSAALGLLANHMHIPPAAARPLQFALQNAEGRRRDAPGDAIELIAIANLQAATIRQALGPDVSAIDVKSALDRACRDGIASASVDVAHLYELEKETWAPTSERSRAQAGFQASLGGHAKSSTAAP
jgi:hypothetical protein